MLSIECSSSMYSSAHCFLWFLSLLNFPFCSCIIFLILFSHLTGFLCSALRVFMTIIFNSFQAIHRSTFLWGWLLENYCTALVMSHLLDFSCFLLPFVNVYIFKVENYSRLCRMCLSCISFCQSVNPGILGRLSGVV